jgi:hypothetical protein
MKSLDKAPRELMIVEADENTDPYNSGIFKRPSETDLLFLLDGKTVIGDTTTIVSDYWS